MPTLGNIYQFYKAVELNSPAQPAHSFIRPKICCQARPTHISLGWDKLDFFVGASLMLTLNDERKKRV